VTPERRVRLAVALFAGVVVVGVVGYQLIEGYTLVEALYMTVITVATVGFREVRPMGTGGMLFTIALITAGLAAVTFAVASGIEFVVEGHLSRMIERRRMDRAIESLRDHVIICGFGRVGRHLAADLQRNGVPLLIIDTDPATVEEVEAMGLSTLRGDSTAEHVLVDAGIDRARAVVACVNTDADNVLTTLTAKGLRPELVVIGRIKSDENEAKMRRAGADRVIAPSTIGGRRIAQLLTRPVVADFLDRVAGSGGLEYTFEEVPVRLGAGLDGASLREAGIRERYGCTVLAILGADGRLDTHPQADKRLSAGDVLVVIGGVDEVEALRAHFATA
jgi:voltage-gated potassium channel